MSYDEEFKMDLPQCELKTLIYSAGGRCSICQKYLYLFDSGKTVTMEAGHIVSKNKGHPSEDFDRYDNSLSIKERDGSYENRILLCHDCHLITGNPLRTEFTVERLKEIKKDHEKWIKKIIEGDGDERDKLKKHLGMLEEQLQVYENQLMSLARGIQWTYNETKKANEKGDSERITGVLCSSPTAINMMDVVNSIVSKCSVCGSAYSMLHNVGNVPINPLYCSLCGNRLK